MPTKTIVNFRCWYPSPHRTEFVRRTSIAQRYTHFRNEVVLVFTFSFDAYKRISGSRSTPLNCCGTGLLVHRALMSNPLIASNRLVMAGVGREPQAPYFDRMTYEANPEFI